MAMNHVETERLYDLLAEAIDKARTMGSPDETESLFLAKLAFLALREADDADQAAGLIEQALTDLDRQDP